MKPDIKEDETPGRRYGTITPPELCGLPFACILNVGRRDWKPVGLLQVTHDGDFVLFDAFTAPSCDLFRNVFGAGPFKGDTDVMLQRRGERVDQFYTLRGWLLFHGPPRAQFVTMTLPCSSVGR